MSPTGNTTHLPLPGPFPPLSPTSTAPHRGVPCARPLSQSARVMACPRVRPAWLGEGPRPTLEDAVAVVGTADAGASPAPSAAAAVAGTSPIPTPTPTPTPTSTSGATGCAVHSRAQRPQSKKADYDAEDLLDALQAAAQAGRGKRRAPAPRRAPALGSAPAPTTTPCFPRAGPSQSSLLVVVDNEVTLRFVVKSRHGGGRRW